MASFGFFQIHQTRGIYITASDASSDDYIINVDYDGTFKWGAQVLQADGGTTYAWHNNGMFAVRPDGQLVISADVSSGGDAVFFYDADDGSEVSGPNAMPSVDVDSAAWSGNVVFADNTYVYAHTGRLSSDGTVLDYSTFQRPNGIGVDPTIDYGGIIGIDSSGKVYTNLKITSYPVAGDPDVNGGNLIRLNTSGVDEDTESVTVNSNSSRNFGASLTLNQSAMTTDRVSIWCVYDEDGGGQYDIVKSATSTLNLEARITNVGGQYPICTTSEGNLFVVGSGFYRLYDSSGTQIWNVASSIGTGTLHIGSAWHHV